MSSVDMTYSNVCVCVVCMCWCLCVCVFVTHRVISGISVPMGLPFCRLFCRMQLLLTRIFAVYSSSASLGPHGHCYTVYTMADHRAISSVASCTRWAKT